MNHLSSALHFTLLCHLLGDYVFQSHAMAVRKTSSGLWASIHALLYGVPYAALITAYATSFWSGVVAWLVIVVTHGLIDRYRVATYWCGWWGIGEAGQVWPSEGTGEAPPFLRVWLTILVDNILHLTINTIALIYAT